MELQSNFDVTISEAVHDGCKTIRHFARGAVLVCTWVFASLQIHCTRPSNASVHYRVPHNSEVPGGNGSGPLRKMECCWCWGSPESGPSTAEAVIRFMIYVAV